jgi:hypothetical protein
MITSASDQLVAAPDIVKAMEVGAPFCISVKVRLLPTPGAEESLTVNPCICEPDGNSDRWVSAGTHPPYPVDKSDSPMAEYSVAVELAASEPIGRVINQVVGSFGIKQTPSVITMVIVVSVPAMRHSQLTKSPADTATSVATSV